MIYRRPGSRPPRQSAWSATHRKTEKSETTCYREGCGGNRVGAKSHDGQSLVVYKSFNTLWYACSLGEEGEGCLDPAGGIVMADKALKTVQVVNITIYAPVIYTAPCIMFWMGANTLRGEVGGGWALEFPRFWALWNGNKTIGEFHLGPKKLGNSRAQPPPTSPSNVYAPIQNIMHRAV
jgi:hypothetical protein